MSLGKLLPNSAKTKKEDESDTILYLFLVEFGWTYEAFINTPFPVITRLMRKYKKVKEAEAKANKKK